MAKLERPKGYSRKLWKKLQNQIRNIKRFVREKTKSGVEVKSTPNTEDVYTKEGRKRIRDWSAKKQWEQSEYVNRETGEVLRGQEAKKAWSRDRRREREQEEKPEDAPTHDVYDVILDELNKIPDTRAAYNRGNRVFVNINTGGMRTQLIYMLNDIADDEVYLNSISAQVASGVYAIQFSSGQEDIYYAYERLLTLFNGGKVLSKSQWDELQDTALNY